MPAHSGRLPVRRNSLDALEEGHLDSMLRCFIYRNVLIVEV